MRRAFCFALIYLTLAACQMASPVIVFPESGIKVIGPKTGLEGFLFRKSEPEWEQLRGIAENPQLKWKRSFATYVPSKFLIVTDQFKISAYENRIVLDQTVANQHTSWEVENSDLFKIMTELFKGG